MRTLVTAAFAAALAGAWIAPSEARAAGPSQESMDMLRDAAVKGFGDTCDLAGHKAEREGYFRCMDVGPYRFSFGDRTVHGYVVLKDAEPFPFMDEGDDGSGGYTVGGPWERDLDARVAAWYADEVQGARARRETSRADADRARAAGEAVEGYGGRAQPQQAPAMQPAPPPPPYGQYAPDYRQYPPQAYAQPPGYQQQYQPAPYQQGGYVPGAPAPDSSPLAVPTGPATRLLAPGTGR